MILYNNNMIPLLARVTIKDKTLDKALSQIIEKGFDMDGKLYFLSFFRSVNLHHDLEHFTDSTGFEAFINSFHVEDFTESDYITQGILFLNQMFKVWDKINPNHDKVLKGYLSTSGDGAVVKMHLIRPDERYMNEARLDDFEEGVLIITSTAKNFFMR